MRFNKAFYLIGCGLLLLAAFIYLSPSFVSSELIFPQRFDSLYVVYRGEQEGIKGRPEKLLFNPGDLSLDYQEFTVYGDDSTAIKGWYIPSEDTAADQTLLLMHDLNGSRISLLEEIRQFHDRGFNVCTYDLRAHGTSGSKVFSIGLESVSDLDAVIAWSYAAHSDRLAVCGKGISCSIAYLSLLMGGKCDALVMESPFASLETYLRRRAAREWGVSAAWWYPVLERQIAGQIQVPVYQLDLRGISRTTDIPTLFLAGTKDDFVLPTETYAVFEHCIAPQKDLLLIKEARHGELAAVGGEQYYNGISTFLNTVMPRRQKSSNRKRLALSNDHPGNDRPDPSNRPH